ncbi:Uncharacterized protein DBV15_01329 [Temnothorax longispinosus]|uniref:Uncharacterized protein n=1 Tax=Temnothorax longispinosus TaxID=300112 RepID=A0A4S2KP77_9HYME|nr:Uncharacterized protein DBV15_01329 [Temnothorax longispinosus]
MKFFIAQPWLAPVVHGSPVVHAAPVVHAPQPWVAPVPKYLKVAAPVAHAKQVYHAHYIPQQPAIPPPHPGPLHIKGNDHVTRLHYSGPHIPHPHLVGVEHYVPAPEPAISVVKTHGHGWA